MMSFAKGKSVVMIAALLAPRVLTLNMEDQNRAVKVFVTDDVEKEHLLPKTNEGKDEYYQTHV